MHNAQELKYNLPCKKRFIKPKSRRTRKNDRMFGGVRRRLVKFGKRWFYLHASKNAERLERIEWKLALRIMDAQNLAAEERSADSFICGLHLALRAAHEWNRYE